MLDGLEAKDSSKPILFFSDLEQHSSCLSWPEVDCINVVRPRLLLLVPLVMSVTGDGARSGAARVTHQRLICPHHCPHVVVHLQLFSQLVSCPCSRWAATTSRVYTLHARS